MLSYLEFDKRRIKRGLTGMANKLLKYFKGYVIFDSKRDVEVHISDNFSIKSSNYKFPYIILSMLEIFLLTFSMLYLFSIKDFSFNKIKNFLIIIFMILVSLFLLFRLLYQCIIFYSLFHY